MSYFSHIFSMSLSIVSVSAYVMDLSRSPSVDLSVRPEIVLWQTVEWIQMPFGTVSGVG